MKISERPQTIEPLVVESDKEYCRASIDNLARKEADIAYRKRGIGEAAITEKEDEFQEKNPRERMKKLLNQIDPNHNHAH